MKMRGSNHSREFRRYDITDTGVLLRESLRGYDAIRSGMPTPQLRLAGHCMPGSPATKCSYSRPSSGRRRS